MIEARYISRMKEMFKCPFTDMFPKMLNKDLTFILLVEVVMFV